MRLRNISPLGALEIAWHGFVEAGETFDVKPEHVDGLIRQLENFEPADEEAEAARAATEDKPASPIEDSPAVIEPSDPPSDSAENTEVH